MNMKTQPARTLGIQQRGKFIAMSAYIKNTERSKIIDLMLYLKLLENKNKLNPKPAEG
jgi:hypothetical protein